MKIYEETVVIPAETFDRVNRLLLIDTLEEMSDAELRSAGANTKQCEGVFFVRFADGSSLNFDLCSGTSNYWDDVVWTSADGENSITFDCNYELADVEFDCDGNRYIVRIVREEEVSRNQTYTQDGYMLKFVPVETCLSYEKKCKLLSWFDIQYGNTDQDLEQWAPEYQMLARMLLHHNMLLSNPRFLDLDEVENDLISIIVGE